MNPDNSTHRVAVRTKFRRECSAALLVLRSVGIEAEMRHFDGDWLLLVAEEDWENSVEQLREYHDENTAAAVQANERVTTQYGGAVAGVVVYAICLIMFAMLDFQSLYEIQWRSSGSSQSGRVVAGETWRVVTALTLHADVEHLAGNLVFGGLFGLIAGRVLGGGVAWLAIVLAGGLGNYINAMVQAAEHNSIGASTAVFASLGLTVAHALRHRAADRVSRLKRWSPLIAGVVLFGFTGIGGERTDVLAHVTGFVSGLIVGWIGSALPAKTLSNRSVQTICATAAVGLVVIAWVIGVASAN